jgi:mRNA interferase HigB
MRVIAKRTLREFWQSSPRYADVQGPIEAWHAETSKASWRTPQEVKAQFGSASILKGGRVVFNIAGNKYRLVVSLDYERQACFVKFIGTHEQYDRIDAETVRYVRSSHSN